jgi:hypothetical protein
MDYLVQRIQYECVMFIDESISKPIPATTSLFINDFVSHLFRSAPEGPPRDLIVRQLNSSSCLVKWSEPSHNQRNGIITGYQVKILFIPLSACKWW